ncbi:hypothetical protein DM02DRAFT_126512 [Periconia macrospinosa]|uniref:Uncharacterized protein n=1 Tax=Periconia macrospinosa TaxID=97972 RepID=A0A2V1E4P9_9PLEO|nr:hypothetical protein DM02DRAFT_126512 [Periconia macrospinosa]
MPANRPLMLHFSPPSSHKYCNGAKSNPLFTHVQLGPVRLTRKRRTLFATWLHGWHAQVARFGLTAPAFLSIGCHCTAPAASRICKVPLIVFFFLSSLPLFTPACLKYNLGRKRKTKINLCQREKHLAKGCIVLCTPPQQEYV